MSTRDSKLSTLRKLVLAILAAGFGFYSCRVLYPIFPLGVARLVFGAIVLLTIGVVIWRLWVLRKIKLRTLVILVPIVLAILCVPFRLVVVNRELHRRFTKPGVTFKLEPRGELVSQLEQWTASLLGSGLAARYDTRVAEVSVDLSNYPEGSQELLQLPSDARQLAVYVPSTKSRLPLSVFKLLGTVMISEEFAGVCWWGGFKMHRSGREKLPRKGGTSGNGPK